jgi:hypothetical protein
LLLSVKEVWAWWGKGGADLGVKSRNRMKKKKKLRAMDEQI